jgi:hypothetical protein
MPRLLAPAFSNVFQQGLKMDQSERSEMRLLVGSWRLQSLGITFSDTGERVEQFGPNPVGRMVLAETGRIMFLFGKPYRAPPASDKDRANLFSSMVAYTGTVRVDGPGRFITTIDLAMNPAVRGEQVRLFELVGDRLSIRTPKQTLAQFGNRLLIADLTWIREHS